MEIKCPAQKVKYVCFAWILETISSYEVIYRYEIPSLRPCRKVSGNIAIMAISGLEHTIAPSEADIPDLSNVKHVILLL